MWAVQILLAELPALRSGKQTGWQSDRHLFHYSASLSLSSRGGGGGGEIVEVQHLSFGRASDGKARYNTDMGSIPLYGKEFSARVSCYYRLSCGVHTAPVYSRMQQPLCAHENPKHRRPHHYVWDNILKCCAWWKHHSFTQQVIDTKFSYLMKSFTTVRATGSHKTTTKLVDTMKMENHVVNYVFRFLFFLSFLYLLFAVVIVFCFCLFC